MSFIDSLFSKQKKQIKTSESKSRYGGIIAYLGLDDFWDSCNSQEQADLIRYCKSGLTTGSVESPIEGNINSSSESVHSFLSSMLTWANSEKNYSLAEKIIQYAHKTSYSNVLSYHFFLQTTADNYYKQKDIIPEALDKVIEFCKEDIALFPHISNEMIKKYGSVPRISTFQTLAMAYEKKQMYSEAIDVCQLALNYGQQDTTKGGYDGRIERLKKKL